MYDEMTLENTNAATIRLVNCSWANYLTRLLQRLKSVGRLQRASGTEALIKRLKRTRPDTYFHSVRVSRLCRTVGSAFGFDDARLKQLCYASVLHDVGKILVPEVVLNRPRKPTPTEFFILHKHPSFGALLASYFNLPAELRIRTQHHHERWDGRGYPHKLGGEDIPLMARIVQVADTYDAMVADRPYRKALSHEAAAAELRKCSGKQFDPRVIEAFLDTYQLKETEV
ncbi:MAG TPA: HD-GYP domain-containing protein [Pyrinomonadaceae bacterium]|jgi:HD-GYP domain-containing protein (c-di-GMP phosphodiesterase class II)|nr:HD-GYP domain-containing protein [Pyrinomonadaceae bacterium]